MPLPLEPLVAGERYREPFEVIGMSFLMMLGRLALAPQVGVRFGNWASGRIQRTTSYTKLIWSGLLGGEVTAEPPETVIPDGSLLTWVEQGSAIPTRRVVGKRHVTTIYQDRPVFCRAPQSLRAGDIRFLRVIEKGSQRYGFLNLTNGQGVDLGPLINDQAFLEQEVLPQSYGKSPKDLRLFNIEDGGAFRLGGGSVQVRRVPVNRANVLQRLARRGTEGVAIRCAFGLIANCLMALLIEVAVLKEDNLARTGLAAATSGLLGTLVLHHVGQSPSGFLASLAVGLGTELFVRFI